MATDDAGVQSNGGAEAAAASIDFLAQLCKIGIGIEFAVKPRNDGISNAELIRIHALEGVNRKDIGNVKRSIYPDKASVEEAGKAFAAAVAKQLDRIGKTYTRRIGKGVDAQKITGVYTEEKQVKQAGASALKAAAIIYHDAMEKNLTDMKNTDGSPMTPVKDDYAKRRMFEHMVSPGSIMQATGQLSSAFQSGKYVLYYDPSKISAIKQAFKI